MSIAQRYDNYDCLGRVRAGRLARAELCRVQAIPAGLRYGPSRLVAANAAVTRLRHHRHLIDWEAFIDALEALLDGELATDAAHWLGDAS